MKRWKITLIILAILTIMSCQSMKESFIRAQNNRQKLRMEKLIQKFSLDSTLYQTDTIVLERFDTLSIPEIVVDTIMEYRYDSVLVATKDGVTTEIIVTVDSIWFETTVHQRDTVLVYKDTTIIQERIKLVDKTPEDTSNDWKWYHYLLAGTTTFLFSIAFIMLITKRRRR